MASIKKIEGKEGVSYKITVSMGRDAQDRQIRHYKTWKPDRAMTARQMEKEVRKVAYEFERELELGFAADDQQTFSQYAEYVYTLREQRGDKPATLERVRRQTARINEYIGHMKLRGIRPQHLTSLYKKLSEPGNNLLSVYAVPIVDFNELRGNDTYEDFAKKCGVYSRIAIALCHGKWIKCKNAEIIEEHLRRKDLFKITNTGSGLSATTIRSYHGVISVVLQQAVDEMIIPYNPAEKAALPKKQSTRQTESIQPELLQRILQALETEPIDFRTMINLFIVTGCRRGEILALKWDNVFFDCNQIKIECSLNYLPECGIYEGSTKTENIRFITLPTETMVLLKKYRAWQIERRLQLGDMWQNTGYVFTKPNGTAINPGTVNNLLNQFCDRHGFPRINPHKFRHTAASILLTSGIDVLTVSKMLGHQNTTTTLNIYGHSVEEANRRAAECVSETILRNKRA